jgi:hypothetical protein
MLGMVIAPHGKVPNSFPYGIQYSYGGDGTYMCPYDPYYNQRGEIGFYHDTQLGMPAIGLLEKFRRNRAAKAIRKQRGMRGLGSSVPGDIELAPTYGYTPHMTGWVHFKEGFYQNPWVSPDGWRPSPLSGLGCPGSCPSYAMHGLAQIPTNAPIDPEVASVLKAMNDHNQKVFTLSIITTLAVAVSAIVTTIRNTKALREESRLLKRELAVK